MTVDAELFGDALPTYLTRFIGRERECAEITALLGRPGVITVCGVGGAGKTRLAVELARRTRADGPLRVCWVPLVAAVNSSEIVAAIAQRIGLGASAHLSQLRGALGSERTLMVLDNCEHLLSGCQQLLVQLLPDCGELSVLTTSRLPLGIPGERVYGIPALGGSIGGDGGRADEPLALFVDRRPASPRATPRPS